MFPFIYLLIHLFFFHSSTTDTLKKYIYVYIYLTAFTNLIGLLPNYDILIQF